MGLVQDVMVPLAVSNFQVELVPLIDRMVGESLVMERGGCDVGVWSAGSSFVVPAVFTWPQAISCPAFAHKVSFFKAKLIVTYVSASLALAS